MVVDDDVLAALHELAVLAPLHNPVNVAGIEQARRVWPDVPHVAVFDTAFHHTLPPHAYTYAVPPELGDPPRRPALRLPRHLLRLRLARRRAVSRPSSSGTPA